MTIHETKLAAKVAAQNEANQLANQARRQIAAALAPFVGQKVCKVGGALFKKVRAALPDILGGYYSTGRGYTLTANFKACSKTRQGDYQVAQYAEATIYAANLSSNGVLTGLIDSEPLRHDFTESEIIAARAEVNLAKEKLSGARSKLAGFGEYDV